MVYELMRFAFIALPRDERNRVRFGALSWPERMIFGKRRLKDTYFGHEPFGFQSLSYVIHGWDVS